MVSIGGGSVPFGRFALMLAVVLMMWAGFVAVSHLVLPGGRKGSVLRSGSSRFFLGMFIFLLVVKTTSTLTGSLNFGLVLFAALSVGGGLMWFRSRGRGWARSFHVPLSLSHVLLWGSLLAVLIFVTPYRGGPLYDEIAHYIQENGAIPVINRHYAQSILASIPLLVIESGIYEARVGVSLWLFAALIAFCALVVDIVGQLLADQRLAFLAAYAFLFGNTGLSLLPIIPYDHDYPYVFNIYSDSLMGLAGFAIFLLVFVEPLSLVCRLALLSIIAAAWIYAAELNVLVALLILLAWMVGSVLRSPKLFSSARASLVAVAAIAAGAGLATLQGGAFLPETIRPVVAGDIGVDHGAETIQESRKPRLLDVGTWYRPVVIPGVWLDFGNFPVEPSTVGGENSINKPLYNSNVISAFRADETPISFSQIIFLFERRLFDYVKYMFFPLLGVALLLVRTDYFTSRGLIMDWGERLDERAFRGAVVLIVLSSFAICESILVLSNLGEGGSLYWKWALTRISEPGIALAMLAFVVIALNWALDDRKRLPYVTAALVALTIPSWYRIVVGFVLFYR